MYGKCKLPTILKVVLTCVRYITTVKFTTIMTLWAWYRISCSIWTIISGGTRNLGHRKVTVITSCTNNLDLSTLGTMVSFVTLDSRVGHTVVWTSIAGWTQVTITIVTSCYCISEKRREKKTLLLVVLHQGSILHFEKGL
jgi:hypothetical protein